MHENASIIAIDIGTSRIKAACVDERGEVVSLSVHQVGAPGANRWREASALACREAVSAARSAGWGDPAAVVLSGNGPSIVPVDRDGEEVSDTLLWYDNRHIERVEGCKSFFLPRIAWLYRNAPAEADRVRWFLSCPEYLIYVLTGDAVTIRTNDEFTPYIWDEQQATAYGVEWSKLPPFRYTGDHVGTVSADVLDRWGLPAGCPVIAGGYDFIMSLIGTDTLAPGRTCDRAGTSEGINHCAGRPAGDSRLRSLPHVNGRLVNVAGVLSSTGRLFEWFRSISGQTGKSYDTMMQEILETEAGAEPWFFPTLHEGAEWEFSSGMFIGLGAEHGAADMGRAVVESIGFAVREAVQLIESAGFSVSELRACGGQSKNTLWNQMKADIVGRPVAVMRVPDAEIIGNAAAGFTGLGIFPAIEHAASQLVRVEQRFEPDLQATARYSELFERYVTRYARFRRALSEEA